MSNKGGQSKQHGLANIHILRKKSKSIKRRQKMAAAITRKTRQEENQKHYDAALKKISA